MKSLARFLLLAALAACQPLPQPFAEDRPPPGDPILTLKDAAGIWVTPLEDHPEEAERLAEALRAAGTPASTTAQNRASWRVAGRNGAGGLIWDVFDPEGRLVGAATDARQIAALVQEEAPAEVAIGKPAVLVPLVEGAPGDGSRSLARAMAAALRNAQIEITEDDNHAWKVKGRVVAGAPVNRRQHVEIVWELLNLEGQKIYEVKQANEIPAGQLDGPWGDIAWAVASAAAEAIVPLIERATRQ